MDNRKETERAELHRIIWNIANDLRGSVDGWDFKQYVLGMLFYRYISENLAAYIDKGEWDAGNKGFSYADLFLLRTCGGLPISFSVYSFWRDFLCVFRIFVHGIHFSTYTSA